MAFNYTSKSNPSLEARITEASRFEDIRELCKAAVGRGDLEQPAPLLAPRPEPRSDTLLRRAVRLENGTVRLLEGYSESGLDILGKALKSGQV